MNTSLAYYSATTANGNDFKFNFVTNKFNPDP